ncbi:MAG: hypothetical protein HY263_08620 [Chloroflexi bacterium]|nr:hypothetical protein [Chloroflexota bacterium]
MPPEPSTPIAGSRSAPSIVGLIGVAFDAELAALAWLLVEGGIPLVVAVPPGREGAGLELARGILASVRPDPAEAGGLAAGLDRPLAWALVHGHRPGAVVVAGSLEDLRNGLAQPPIQLSEQELSFLGCVLVLGAPEGRPAGRLRVIAAHYVRPLARDAHGHAQLLPPAVLATWDARLGRYEHFAWGVLPEIAARLGRKAGDLEADLHHRRDDLAGLATAKLTELAEVRRLIAGYQVGYGHGHGARAD